jgi:hypothetical protein
VDLDLVKYHGTAVPGPSKLSCVILNLKIYGPSELLFRAGAGAGVCFLHSSQGKVTTAQVDASAVYKKSTRVPVSPVPQYGYSA